MKLFIEAFFNINGSLLAVIGILASFGLWAYSPSQSITIDIKFTFIILFSALIILLTVLNCIHLMNKRSEEKDFEINKLRKMIIPRVIEIITDDLKNEIYFILEPSNIFSQDSCVGIYCKPGMFEIFIGYGVVHNIQANHLIQVKLIKLIDSQQSYRDKFISKNIDVFSSIIIKPHLSLAQLQRG